MFLLALSLNAVGCFPTCLQLELERMRCQEVAAARADLQQQLGELQQRVQAQAGAVETAQLRAAQAEARRLEATQQVGALACSSNLLWLGRQCSAMFQCPALSFAAAEVERC